jgi:hypothetical protein
VSTEVSSPRAGRHQPEAASDLFTALILPAACLRRTTQVVDGNGAPLARPAIGFWNGTRGGSTLPTPLQRQRERLRLVEAGRRVLRRRFTRPGLANPDPGTNPLLPGGAGRGLIVSFRPFALFTVTLRRLQPPRWA